MVNDFNNLMEQNKDCITTSFVSNLEAEGVESWSSSCSPRPALGTLNQNESSQNNNTFRFSFHQSGNLTDLSSSTSSPHRQQHFRFDRAESPFSFHKAGAGFRKSQKRDVKREAVEKLMSSLDLGSLNSTMMAATSCQGEPSSVTKLFAPVGHSADSESPIEELHKLCSQQLHLIPHYVNEIDQSKGLPHKKGQAVICKVGPHLSERGRGYTLKQAKKNAACKMMNRIKALVRNREREDSENICDFDFEDDEDVSRNDVSSLHLVDKIRDLNISTGHSSANHNNN